MPQSEKLSSRLVGAFNVLTGRSDALDPPQKDFSRAKGIAPGGPFVEPPGAASLTLGRAVNGAKRQAFLSDAEQVTLFGMYNSGAGAVQDSLVAQQIARRGAYVLLDVTLDEHRKDMLAYLHRTAETQANFRVLNVDARGTSHTYNPLARGTAREVAERVVTAMMGPTYLNPPMTDTEHSTAVSLLEVLLQALQDRDGVAQFDRLDQALENDAGFVALVTAPELQATTCIALQARLAKYQTGPNGPYDLKAVWAPLARMLQLLPDFASGTMGEVVNVANPEIDLLDVLTTHKGLFVMLPTMGKDKLAITLGRLVMADMADSLATVAARPRNPVSPPALVVTVETPCLANGNLADTFASACAADVTFVAGVASPLGLDFLAQSDRDALLGNTRTKVFFQLNSRVNSEDLRQLGALLAADGGSANLPEVMSRLVSTPAGKGFVARSTNLTALEPWPTVEVLAGFESYKVPGREPSGPTGVLPRSQRSSQTT